ncbi:MAG: hypothetical protein IPO40_17880 [Fibrobacteres bacterium]|nr:hypothetical protein [Fibrobacterota bacterium]
MDSFTGRIGDEVCRDHPIGRSASLKDPFFKAENHAGNICRTDLRLVGEEDPRAINKEIRRLLALILHGAPRHLELLQEVFEDAHDRGVWFGDIY